MVSGQVRFRSPLQKTFQRTSPRNFASSLGAQTSCQPIQARTSWPTRVGQLVRGPASKVEFGLKRRGVTSGMFCILSDNQKLKLYLKTLCSSKLFAS